MECQWLRVDSSVNKPRKRNWFFSVWFKLQLNFSGRSRISHIGGANLVGAMPTSDAPTFRNICNQNERIGTHGGACRLPPWICQWYSHHAGFLFCVNPQHKIRFLVGFVRRGDYDVISRRQFVTSAVLTRVNILRRCRHWIVSREKLLTQIPWLGFSRLKFKKFQVVMLDMRQHANFAGPSWSFFWDKLATNHLPDTILRLV